MFSVEFSNQIIKQIKRFSNLVYMNKINHKLMSSNFSRDDFKILENFFKEQMKIQC